MCEGKVFRLAKSVLDEKNFQTASTIMETALAHLDHTVALRNADGSRRKVSYHCKKKTIMAPLVPMLQPVFDLLLPGVDLSKCIRHIQHLKDPKDDEENHLDDEAGGPVAVYSTGATGVLHVRRTASDECEDEGDVWDAFNFDPNDLFILAGHKHMHRMTKVHTQAGKLLGVFEMALGTDVWPSLTSSSPPSSSSSSSSSSSPEHGKPCTTSC